jgi:hypothetical protein
MQKHNSSNHGFSSSNKPYIKTLGIAFIVVSYVLYAGILLVPFAPLTVGTKGIICTTLFVVKEILFWFGVVIAGKAIMMKYVKYLNFLPWTNKKHDYCKQTE